jgi:hypothetical protein
MEEDTLRRSWESWTSRWVPLILIASVLLSFYTVVIQRGLCLTILEIPRPPPACLTSIYQAESLRHGGGSLGFFLCLALNACSRRSGGRLVAGASAAVNLWASLFVLLAVSCGDWTWILWRAAPAAARRRSRSGTAGGQYTNRLDHPFQEATYDRSGTFGRIIQCEAEARANRA